MTYTGQTQVGSAPLQRNLGTMRLTKIAVGPLDNNVYVLRAPDGATLVVDAAADAPRILAATDDGRIDAVLTTHCHQDHWGALAQTVAATQAHTYASVEDAPAISVRTDTPLADGDVIDFGDAAVDVILLRGHTPGGLALHVQDAGGGHHLITGDSLFPGGVGRTTPETFPTLLADVRTKLFDRYHDAWVYPGHGWDTTLAAERPYLDAWALRGW